MTGIFGAYIWYNCTTKKVHYANHRKRKEDTKKTFQLILSLKHKHLCGIVNNTLFVSQKALTLNVTPFKEHSVWSFRQEFKKTKTGTNCKNAELEMRMLKWGPCLSCTSRLPLIWTEKNIVKSPWSGSYKIWACHISLNN